MPTWGTDAASSATDGAIADARTIICGGVFAPGGTLDSVSIYGSADAAPYNNLRVAIYQGGVSDSDPSGATLVWDSGALTLPNATQWHTITAGGQALAAGVRTWIAVRQQTQFYLHYAQAADYDDATFSMKSWATSDASAAFEATVPTISVYTTGPFKFYLTYTAGGSATLQQAAARFRADDGSESGASWLAAQNVNVYRAADLATRIRMLLQAEGVPASRQYQLEYRLSGGSWAAVPGTPAAPSVTFGAIGTGAGGTTSCTPSYPTGISASTSELLCFVTGRSNTANTAPTMPAGWTKIADLEDGTGTWGVDLGTRRAAVFRKDTVTGSETGTVTVSLSGSTANTLYASIVRFERPAGHTLDVAVATGADTSNDTSFSVTASSSLSWAANDLLAYCIAQNIDTGTHSSQSITASGVTFGTRTNQRSQAVTNGNDHRHMVETVPVTTGSGSSAPTYAATLSTSGSGAAAFVRLRSVAPTQSIRLKASSNIAAAAADTTTQQLTGGTGTFLAGRISDDTNPLPTLDLGEDGCTELEWCVEANSAVVTAGQVYEFRVTAAGSALNGYTVTPTITIGSEPAFAWAALVRRAPTLFRRH